MSKLTVKTVKHKFVVIAHKYPKRRKATLYLKRESDGHIFWGYDSWLPAPLCVGQVVVVTVSQKDPK